MRRTEIVEISEGRDAGKKYQITEMPSEAAEMWAVRAIQAVASRDIEFNFQVPLRELAAQGLKALAAVPYDQLKPLLDEMMTCVQILVPATQKPRALMDGDIEDVKTRFLLRKKIIELHVGFSTGGEEQI